MAYNINIYGTPYDILGNLNTTSFVNASPKGEDGTEGKRGTSLYFANYDLQNDYYKDIVIKKITNNIMLSSDADIKQEGREYINGDLILCSDKSIYMIKLNDGLYDVVFVGKIQDDKTSQDFKDNIINLQLNLSFGFSDDESNPISYGYTNDTKGTIFVTLKPSIYTIGDTNYDYYLRIYLYNKKCMQFGDYAFKYGLSIDNTSYDLSLSNNNIEFYKKIELPVCEQRCNGNDITDYNDSYNVLISEMSMDKLHPSGNNIDIKASHAEDDYNIKYNEDKKEYYLYNRSDVNFDDNTPYTDTHTQVQFTSRHLNSNNQTYINYRGGESCYFSGMKDGEYDSIQEYYNCDETKTRELKKNEMYNFLTSNKNIYELVCVNKSSHKIEIINLNENTVKFNITTNE